jgi:hypothetical protein
VIDFLPACARTHPDQPSQIKVTFARSRSGNLFQRCVCTTCLSARALAQSRNGNTFVVGERPRLEAYGVIKLNWTPPERLLEA